MRLVCPALGQSRIGDRLRRCGDRIALFGDPAKPSLDLLSQPFSCTVGLKAGSVKRLGQLARGVCTSYLAALPQSFLLVTDMLKALEPRASSDTLYPEHCQAVACGC